MKTRLTEADRQWLVGEIKEAVRLAVREALTAEMQWEKVRDETTGAPLKHPERRSEKVFLPAFFCQMLPFYEQAIRGLQEDCSKANNRSLEAAAKVDALGQTLISMEGSVKTMARFAGALRRMGLLDRLDGELHARRLHWPPAPAPPHAQQEDVEEVPGDEGNSA
jgi:hypothetical protein